MGCFKLKYQEKAFPPFGMAMNTYVNQDYAGYRYGFNGKERDDEIKGAGNSYDFGARIYDSRLGRWMSPDKLSNKYASFSPYNFAVNNPIFFVDTDGNDFFIFVFEDAFYEVQLLQLKSTIEGRFNGLVTVNFGEIAKREEKVLDPISGKVVIKVTEIQQVTMTINEEKLTALATEQAGEGASVDVIEAKKKELREELTGDPAYVKLETMMMGDTDVDYMFQESGLASFGKPQGLNMGQITLYENIGKLTAFNILYHELVEGYSYALRSQNDPKSPFNKADPYQHNHYNALVAQAEELGLDFIYTDIESNNWPADGREDGWVIVYTFEKVVDKGSTMYIETKYKIRMIGNKIQFKEGTEEVNYTESTDKITPEKFKAHKAKAIKAIQARKPKKD